MNFTCETEGNCFSQVKIDEHTNEILKIFGCLPREPSGNVAIFHCQRGERELEKKNSVLCCYDRNFCNKELEPTLKPTKKQTSEWFHIGDHDLVMVVITMSRWLM